jgi:L-alanine-DL-glutamate epimerase-like enolase superfamily enzyme
VKITDVKVWVCTREVPPMAHKDHIGSEPWDIVLIRVFTDEGIEGNAFGYGIRSGEVTARITVDLLKPALVGEDPLDREKIWQKIRMLDRWLALFPIYAQGPVDVALWDIAAKKAEMPLYKLIGGYRDSVRAYATAAWAIPDIGAYKRQADEVLSLGFTAYKMTAWGDPQYDIKLMREMRRHVGDDIDLMLDCVSAYDHRTALKVGRVAEELDFYWFEEPLWDHDIHGLVKLCSALDIPVVATETLPGANYSIAEYIIRGAADIVRSDVMWKGGVTSTQKTMHLADCFGMNCEVHTSQYSLTDVANLHLVCSAKNCDFYELLFPLEFYSDYGVLNPVRVASDGTVSAPQAPGLGLEIDWGLLERTRVLEL